MSKLTRNNLQEFCRTCLSSLQKRRIRGWDDGRHIHSECYVDTANDCNSIQSYNLNLLPQLQKIFVLFTSLDLIKDDNELYPRSLCQLCYEKLVDFQEFRKLAINSAEILYKIVNNIGEENNDNPDGDISKPSVSGETKSQRMEVEVLKRSHNNNDDDGDDDQLLLPELASLMQNAIKSEPVDINIDQIDEQLLPNDNCFEDSSKSFVKNEIDSEYEDDDSLYYESNALNTSYKSNSVDADDNYKDNTQSNDFTNRKSNSHANNFPENVEARQRPTVAIRKRDRNKKSLKCPRCDKQAYKQVYLDAHIRAVHEGHEKPFLCVECQKSFTRYDQLRTHIQSKHVVQEVFRCGINGCDATFKLGKTLETHRSVVHTSATSYGFTEMLEQHRSQLSREKEMENVCPHCFKSYSSKRALYEHQRRHSDIRNHVCKVCGVAKVTSRELRTHMRTHEPNSEKFKCSICPQEFNHKNAISRHVRVVHEGQRRFLCNYCPKRFGTRNSQICHERLHTGERPFCCELCYKRYPQIEGLKSHMKSHDKNLRKHVCSICSQRFITKKNLIDHEKRHQSDKPNICGICSRGFFLVEDLEKHKKSHNSEEINYALMGRTNYDAYQDSYGGEQAIGDESLNENGSENFLGYSSSQSSI